MSSFFKKAQELEMRRRVAKGDVSSEEAQQQLDGANNNDANKTLAKVGLDLASASPSDIKQYNAVSVRKIRSDMAGNGFIKAGVAISGSATERAALGYYSALVEQNWILIRQNELIIRYLEQGKEK